MLLMLFGRVPILHNSAEEQHESSSLRDLLLTLPLKKTFKNGLYSFS